MISHQHIPVSKSIITIALNWLFKGGHVDRLSYSPVHIVSMVVTAIICTAQQVDGVQVDIATYERRYYMTPSENIGWIDKSKWVFVCHWGEGDWIQLHVPPIDGRSGWFEPSHPQKLNPLGCVTCPLWTTDDSTCSFSSMSMTWGRICAFNFGTKFWLEYYSCS